MLVVWGSLLTFFIHYADEISRDPCGICANRSGNYVTCILGSPMKIPLYKTYHPNWSVSDNAEELKKEIFKKIDEQKTQEVNASNYNLTVSN
jgi:hypothetical protein